MYRFLSLYYHTRSKAYKLPPLSRRHRSGASKGRQGKNNASESPQVDYVDELEQRTLTQRTRLSLISVSVVRRSVLGTMALIGVATLCLLNTLHDVHLIQYSQTFHFLKCFLIEYTSLHTTSVATYLLYTYLSTYLSTVKLTKTN